MRTFTANFTTQAARKDGAKFYNILEIDWGGATGTKYYLDRDSTAFDATGTRVPASGIGTSKVLSWGAISISLKEGEVGATDQTSVTLDDASGEITAILNGAERQRCLVTIWRLFDDASTVWPTDAAQIFTGILRPFDWQAQNNQITLNLGDLGRLLAKDVSCIANNSIFTKLPQSSQDKNIPLCWGRAQRVEALPISVPWETKIAKTSLGTNPETIPITDDLSLLPGVVAETNYDAYLGTDRVTAKFHQSADPTSTLSTVTVSTAAPPVVAVFGGVPQDTGFSFYVYDYTMSYNRFPNHTATDFIVAGRQVLILLQSVGGYGKPGCTVASISVGPNSTAWLPQWQITLNDNLSNDLATAKAAGQTVGVKVLGPSNSISSWPSGTVLRPVNQQAIYAISALPSKAVQIVEGYGSITDSVGDSRKDFVVLGQIQTSITSGSTTSTVVSDWFSINLNDSTWNAAGLGRNITTITFPGSPRDYNTNLENDRIWCTVLGVEDVGNGTGNAITNPATVILQYLENANLMNVATADIDTASFATAASALSGYIVGFPQIETKNGLQLLQEIANQCNSILLFDQGKVSMVVLSDTAGTIRHTFDTTTNDNLLLGSLTTQETSVDDLVNELVVKWTPFWDDITGNKPLDVRNYKSAAITAFGRISQNLDIWLYWRRVDVEAQRDWWLNHRSTVFRTVSFTAFLDALALQPGDWINVTWIDGGGRNLFGGAKSMMVLKVTDTGKDGLVQIDARYPFVTY